MAKEDPSHYAGKKDRVFARAIAGPYRLKDEHGRLRALPHVRKAVRYDGQAGDGAVVHDNGVHRHFDARPHASVQRVSAINRVHRKNGLNDLKQLEDAPEYDPALKLRAELAGRDLSGRVKQPA